MPGAEEASEPVVAEAAVDQETAEEKVSARVREVAEAAAPIVAG